MPVVRQPRINNINQFFADETMRWTPTHRSILSDYICKCGIFHILQIKSISSAQKRLLDLQFVVGFIDSWDSIVKPLSVFRLLERHRFKESMKRYMETVFVTSTTSLHIASMVIQLTKFFEKIGWLDLGEQNTRSALNIFRKDGTDLQAIYDASDLVLAFYIRNEKKEQAIALGQSLFQDKLNTLGPSDASTIRTQLALGDVYRISRRFREAEALYHRVLQLPFITQSTDQRQLGFILGKLAGLTKFTNNSQVGIVHATQQLSIYQAIYDEHDMALLTAQNQLADLLRINGRHLDSESLYLEVLKKRRESFGLEHPSTLTTLGGLSKLYSKQQQFVKAEEFATQNYTLSVMRLGASHVRAIEAGLNLARVYVELNKFVEAEELHRRVYRIQKRNLGMYSPKTEEALNQLIRILNRQGKSKEIRLLRAGHKRHAQTLNLYHELLCEVDDIREFNRMTEYTLRDLLDSHRRNENHEAVLNTLIRLHTHLNRCLGSDHTKTIDARIQTAWAQYHLQSSEAKTTFASILPDIPDSTNWKHHWTRFGLLLTSDSLEDAESCLQYLIEILGLDHKIVTRAQQLLEEFRYRQMNNS